MLDLLQYAASCLFFGLIVLGLIAIWGFILFLVIDETIGLFMDDPEVETGEEV